MSADELLRFYIDAGPDMFDKASLLKRLQNLYESGPLEQKLKKTFGGETTLSPGDLQCLFMAVTRNVTTDSPWPVSSNPLAKYNDTARGDCNLRIPLWQLVRASTAAPIFFPPEVVKLGKHDASKTFVFVDGGVTPYNNPAFLLFRMATSPAYRLGWQSGEGRMMLVSIGTGAAPDLGVAAADPSRNHLANLADLPGALMYGAAVDQDTNCRVIGRCVHGDPLDREVGDLIPRATPDPTAPRIPLATDLGRAFRYARYNAELTSASLAALGLGEIDPKRVSKLDSIEAIGDLRRVGRAVARGVNLGDFGDLA
jgi:uncharacterized protein